MIPAEFDDPMYDYNVVASTDDDTESRVIETEPSPHTDSDTEELGLLGISSETEYSGGLDEIG